MSLFALDTDIYSLHRKNNVAVARHVAAHPPQQIAITVITVEEQLSGWYSYLRQATQPDDVALAYQQLADSVVSLAKLPMLTYTKAAISRYEQLTKMKLNVRKMDLRIAAIALENNAVVVTRNLRDFQRVPNLTVEDWSV
jgi:tRNA(fMet)-specific endonuclease VapC